MQWEDSLDADAKADAPHRKRRLSESPALADDYALIGLDALFFALRLFEAHVHPHGITWAKVGDVFAQLRLLDFFQDHAHVDSPCRPTQVGPARQRQTTSIAKTQAFA